MKTKNNARAVGLRAIRGTLWFAFSAGVRLKKTPRD
jgi:hypothetical protein